GCHGRPAECEQDRKASKVTLRHFSQTPISMKHHVRKTWNIIADRRPCASLIGQILDQEN
ncbi:hypothetical protein, partial [Mesorhizobium sp. M7A.F.Ca.CA.004.04.2.1]|uniref:hypothetical protein n=1 Tax=Mesorhizobium sp. M7A.F.Ca.CA.004.04.2.1 TaxID=2496677 RepID=UPI0019D477E1